MITTNLTGNLGNHMWQYAVCRIVAEKLNYKWGINPSPTHDYFNGQNQMYFMDVDFGNDITDIQYEYHEKGLMLSHKDIVNITVMDKNIFNINDNTIILGHNGAKGANLQDEEYFNGRENNVKSWFKINDEYKLQYETKLKELNIVLDENLCVINFRGGEYRSIPNVLLRREYWRDCILHMQSINKNIKFLLITDDINCAYEYMPFHIPSLHIDIGFDFYVINQAKWLIISNSTFGWWAAWLNEKSNKIIAPKYWARHNVSNGYWAVGRSYTKGFYYMDRYGNLLDYDTCKQQAEDFYKEHNLNIF